jgi:hypothetical protein
VSSPSGHPSATARSCEALVPRGRQTGPGIEKAETGAKLID